MALDKTFAAGEILSSGDANNYMRSMWAPIDKRVIAAGSPVSSISFASLDSSFRMFRLSFYLVTSALSTVAIRLNNDSGANYYYQSTAGSGSTTSSSRSTGAAYFDTIAIGMFECVIGKILTTTPGRMHANYEDGNTTTMQNGMMAGHWNNTSALINRIDVLPTGGAITLSGVIALEGMRGI